MNNAICEFDWNLDKNLLIKELPTTETFSSLNPKWEKSFALGKYGLEIEKILSTILTGKLKAGYYYQYKNTEVLEHKDSKCKCCININLTNNTTPIIINNEKIIYECALINVGSFKHSVPKTFSDRIIFRIVFRDDNFFNVFKHLPVIVEKTVKEFK